MAANIGTRWGRFLDVKVEIAVGVYAGHGTTAAKWQQAQPEAHWQPDPVTTKWGAGGGAGGQPGDLVWVDVTCDTVSLSTFRGKDRWSADFEPGTAVAVLRNESGKYSTQIDHPHQSVPLRLGRRFRVSMRAAGDATWHPVFHGTVIDLDEQAAPDGTDTVAVHAADWFAYFAAVSGATYTDLGHTGDTPTERIGHWLDLIEWPADMRTLDPSSTPLVAPADPPATVLDELARIARSDAGFLYIDEDGKVAFHPRDWFTTNPRSTTTQGVLWASPKPPPTSTPPPTPPPVVCPFDLLFDHSVARIRNRVHLATEGQTSKGATVTRQDDASIAAFGFRDYTDQNLLTRDRSDLESIAGLILARDAKAARRVDAARLSIKNLVDARFAAAARIGDLIRVHYEQPGAGWSADTDAHILGVEWRIDLTYADQTLHTDDAI